MGKAPLSPAYEESPEEEFDPEVLKETLLKFLGSTESPVFPKAGTAVDAPQERVEYFLNEGDMPINHELVLGLRSPEQRALLADSATGHLWKPWHRGGALYIPGVTRIHPDFIGGLGATVLPGAECGKNAKAFGYPRIAGSLYDRASIFDFAILGPGCTLCNQAKMLDHSELRDGAWLGGVITISGYLRLIRSVVRGRATIHSDQKSNKKELKRCIETCFDIVGGLGYYVWDFPVESRIWNTKQLEDFRDMTRPPEPLP
jgi:hypothetical protein